MAGKDLHKIVIQNLRNFRCTTVRACVATRYRRLTG